MNGTRHCHRCGWEWTLAGQPDAAIRAISAARIARLPQLRQLQSPHCQQCRDRRAEPVQEKENGISASILKWPAALRARSRRDTRAKQQPANG